MFIDESSNLFFRKLNIPFTLLLCLIGNSAFSQNIIPNGDFQDINICIAYQEDCFPSAWRSTSLKLATFNRSNLKAGPNDQRSISLLYVDRARNFDRRFIQSYLLCALKPGESYSISFDYRSTQPRAKSIGFYFTDSLMFDESNLKFENLEAHEVSLKNDHPNEWKTYTYEFVAGNDSEVLIIGNFKADDQTRQFDLSKKEQKELDNSYRPKNRIWVQLDNLKLIPKSKIQDCDLLARKKFLYSDKVQHTFHVPKTNPTILSTTVKEEKLEGEELSAQLIAAETQPPVLTINLEIGLNRLEGVEFESGTTNLIPSSHTKLDAIVEYLLKKEKTKLKIIGHTDDVGNEIDNHVLSEARANEIRKYLVSKGVAHKRLSSKGMGENSPIASNRTAEGRQTNRRVEVEVYY